MFKHAHIPYWLPLHADHWLAAAPATVLTRCPLRPSSCRTSPTGLTAATLIGKYVTIEPNCVLRSTRIEDHCIVGAKSVLCEGSMMEPYSILAPGSVLPPARRVPEGELWAGSPARFVRKLTKDEVSSGRTSCAHLQVPAARTGRSSAVLAQAGNEQAAR